MATEIPPERRQQVYRRDRHCVNCGGTATDWHHRRTRSVVDEHRHCSCNGVFLCRTCHTWVHKNPSAALGRGLLVSRYATEPGVVPVQYTDGPWLLDCEGGALAVTATT